MQADIGDLYHQLNMVRAELSELKTQPRVRLGNIHAMQLSQLAHAHIFAPQKKPAQGYDVWAVFFETWKGTEDEKCIDWERKRVNWEQLSPERMLSLVVMLYAREDESRKLVTEKLHAEKVQADAHYMVMAQRIKEMELDMQRTLAKHDDEMRRVRDRHAEEMKRCRELQDERDQMREERDTMRAQNMWLTNCTREAADKQAADRIRQSEEACKGILQSARSVVQTEMTKIRDMLSKSYYSEDDVANLRSANRAATATIMDQLTWKK
jgi:hypothetical protein